MILSYFNKFLSTKYCFDIIPKLLPWAILITAALFVYGLIGGLYLAPPDYQQGDGFRIIYIHVPCAMWSMGIFAYMGVMAVLGLVWRIKIAHILLRAAAPIGASITFLALVTGSIWGKPMWGTWWVWDARLTSELILLFIYIGIIALQNALTDKQQAATAGAILTLVGVVDLPIIHFSVNWWNTLHQSATLSLMSKPTIATSMLYPLLAMIAAFLGFFICSLMLRTRNEILSWDQQSRWVKQTLEARA